MKYHREVGELSSNIANIAYCYTCKTLAICFKSTPDSVYTFKHFPYNEYNRFMDSSSFGKFFAEEIKGKYNGDKIKLTDPFCDCFNDTNCNNNFCCNCGSKFEKNDNYCGNCGNKRK